MKQIEVVRKPIEERNPSYVVKKKKRIKKGNILDNAKPRKGTRLARYNKVSRDTEHMHSNTHHLYKGAMSKVEFIDKYLEALHKRPDIMPNIYCSRAWLLAHDVFPARNDMGYLSFFYGFDWSSFFLPAYRYEGDKVFFKAKEAQVNFPLSLGMNEGIRYDVQYMYTRDVSVYMIPKALKVRNTMKNIPYRTFAIPYSDHSKDELLRIFLDTYKSRNCRNTRVMTDDLEGFERMLFNCYGQHRYVIQRTDNDRIVAVLLWEDTGDIINMLYTVGFSEHPAEYGMKQEDWKLFRETKCLRYPEVILRYHFMKSFPKGTMFNGGGCSWYDSMRFMQVISQPSHIFEIRTFRDVDVSPNGVGGGVKIGKLPGEFYLPVKKKEFWIDCANRVLFRNCRRRKLSEMTEHERKLEIRHRKKNAWRFLTLRRNAEKFLKKSENNT